MITIPDLQAKVKARAIDSSAMIAALVLAGIQAGLSAKMAMRFVMDSLDEIGSDNIPDETIAIKFREMFPGEPFPIPSQSRSGAPGEANTSPTLSQGIQTTEGAGKRNRWQ